ncbi:MAG: hypothetical protein RR063_11070 [Anaerovoracaceae bacterium]
MHVEYEDSKVQELFEDLNNVQSSKNLMQKEVGLEMTRAVKKKYNQVIAFSTFSELLKSRIGKMEPLSGDKEGNYSLHLSANYRLIIAPNTKDRSVEGLRICDTIIMKGVTDYHGKGAKNNWIIP